MSARTVDDTATWHIFYWVVNINDEDHTFAAIRLVDTPVTSEVLQIVRYVTGVQISVAILDDVGYAKDIDTLLPFEIVTVDNKPPHYSLPSGQTMGAFTELVRKLVGATTVSTPDMPQSAIKQDRLLIVAGVDVDVDVDDSDDSDDSEGVERREGCETFAMKSTVTAMTMLQTEPFFAQFVSVHSVSEIPVPVANIVDDWLSFYGSTTSSAAKFATIEQATTLCARLLARLAAVAIVANTRHHVAIPSKKLHEEIAVFREHTTTASSGRNISTQTLPEETTRAWTGLQMNAAEIHVLRAALFAATPQLLETRIAQLLLLRWFLYQRVWPTVMTSATGEFAQPDPVTRSAAITAEFNTWLAGKNIAITVAEVGTLLRSLGLTSKRQSAGIHWPTTASKDELANFIVATNLLRETDLAQGGPSLFKTL